ncbi:MAG: hypothetical protein ROW48_17625, partial [Bellilinea sp.]
VTAQPRASLQRRVGGACAPPRGGFAPAPAFLIAHLHHRHGQQVQVSGWRPRNNNLLSEGRF